MEQLSPAYVSALAAQLAGLSAFLGGFAATFLATLLTLDRQDRLTSVAIGLSAVSSVSFVVTVLAATTVTAINHPDAPRYIAAAATSRPQTIMTLGFLLGALALLGSLGCSGWVRSRATGWTTTIAALVGVAFLIAMTVQVR